MSTDELWRLLTSGVVGGILGAFLGGFSKFFWERWLPDQLTWRREQRVRQRQLLATQRDPSVRAINELQSRLWVILSSDASNYFYVKRHGQGSYYIQSTAFLIAQYFAWSELMRQQIAALDYSDLSRRLEKVSDAFAHGGPGFQVWRLEQREIGERLIGAMHETSGAAIFRYAAFRDMLLASEPAECLRRLEQRTQYLLEHVADERWRATRIQNALVDLLDFIDPERRWIKSDRRQRYTAREAPVAPASTPTPKRRHGKKTKRSGQPAT